VTLNDTSSSRLSRSRLLGPIVIPGVTKVDVERQSDQKGADVLIVSHDGYLQPFGYVHERELELNTSGTKIKGRDSVRPSGDGKTKQIERLDAVSRFHIHPSIELTQLDEESVSMSAADGTGWVFSAPGQIVNIAEDVFMADASGIRPSQQIEILFNPAETMDVRWLIEKKP
jgi:uncharacterized heparinase superfamily protein